MSLEQVICGDLPTPRRNQPPENKAEYDVATILVSVKFLSSAGFSIEGVRYSLSIRSGHSLPCKASFREYLTAISPAFPIISAHSYGRLQLSALLYCETQRSNCSSKIINYSSMPCKKHVQIVDPRAATLIPELRTDKKC